MGASIQEVIGLQLAQASKLIASRELSPVELVDACLEQATLVNERINAYIGIFYEEAREAAKASELLLRAGRWLGPLHGIPIGLKDNIRLKDKVATAGSQILSTAICVEDATVAKKLLGSGGVFVGKTNMHEFAWGVTSENPHFGTVRNPWNTDRIAGGSSGGSGAAVASRTCLAALGTDTGGSVRFPAALNGIVGLRPTLGRVSNHGIIPMAWSLDTVGAMARTVTDCALVFQSMAGHDPRDPSSALRAVDNYTAELSKGIKGVRIGVLSEHRSRYTEKCVQQAVAAACDMLEQLGASIVVIDINHWELKKSAQLIIQAAEASTFHQKWLRERYEDYGEDVRSVLAMGEMVPATQYIQAQRYRRLLRTEVLEAFRKVDAIVTPMVPFTAPRLGERKVNIEDRPIDMSSAIVEYANLASLSGVPALSVPCGYDESGLPIGMQIMGRPFEEATLFRVGTSFQDATEFHKRKPTGWMSK